MQCSVSTIAKQSCYLTEQSDLAKQGLYIMHRAQGALVCMKAGRLKSFQEKILFVWTCNIHELSFILECYPLMAVI